MVFRALAQWRVPSVARSEGHVRDVPWIAWALVAASFWLVGGLHLDGWAHTHLPELETFFTPWHGVLYSGFFATAGVVGAWAWTRRRAGHEWRDVLRGPYGLSLVGVGVFLVGGVGDGVWHTLFGIEASVEALLSPTHLLLATGLALMVSGPLRAAFRDETQAPPLAPLLPGLLSASALLSVLWFFTQIWHPFVRPWAGTGNAPTDLVFPMVMARPTVPEATAGLLAADVAVLAGIAGFLLQTTILVGFLLVLVRRFELPFGAFTVLLAPPAILIAFMRDQLWTIPVALGAGLAIDALVLVLQPTLARPWSLRIVAAAAPAVLWAIYLTALYAVEGIWWSVHLVGGAIAVSAGVGLLLSFLVAPPRGSEPGLYV